MGSVDVNGVAWARPGGGELFRDVSFKVGNQERVALVGANGVGKTSLLRLVTGDERPTGGSVRVDGRLGVLRQMAHASADHDTVRDLLVRLAPRAVQSAASALRGAEARMLDRPGDTDAAVRFASALTAWGEAGGYDAEVHWDACCTRALGWTLDDVGSRRLSSLSGGEQKHLALEVLLTGDADILVLDEPDNFLDVASKRWLEDALTSSTKTVVLVSHDRELLARVATKVVTLEAKGAWTHGGSFATYHEARDARLEQIEKDFALYKRERERLVAIMKEMKRRASFADNFAPKAKAAESRLRHYDRAGPAPERVKDQNIEMRLEGGRTGKKVLTLEALALDGLTDPFDAEIWYGERVAVVGPNGTGKSHFLRLLAGDDTVAHSGAFRHGANVVPGYFRQTHDHPEFLGRRIIDLLAARNLNRGQAMAVLRRYEIQGCADQVFETLSGGQQARFQILVLELSGATLLLLDEPTDNLDLASAEALEEGLSTFQGTVICVTHDRWFLRSFDRFLVFGGDCRVTDTIIEPDLAAL